MGKSGTERSVNTGDGYSLSKQGLNGGTFFPNFWIHSFKFLCFPKKALSATKTKERRIQVLNNVPVNSNLLELKDYFGTKSNLLELKELEREGST